MSTDLRKLAKNRECQIRLEGVCNHNPETVVLAHYRMHGLSGMGFKSPDFIGAWACSACHAMVDSDKSDVVQLAFARGCFRTQAQLIRERKLAL